MKKERRYDTSQERIAEKLIMFIFISQYIFKWNHLNFEILNQKSGTVPDLT